MSTTAAPPALASNLGTLQALLEKFKTQIAVALPKHVTPERMIRVGLSAVSRTPLLQKCTQTSVAGALVQASLMGLEPDGISGEAYMVPYWNSKISGYEAQLQPGYIGLVKLARNSGEYSVIDAQAVHERDDFDFQKGSEIWWRHKWPKTGSRGPIIGYWAGYVLKDGGKNFEYWSVEDIEAHRDKYSQGAFKKEKGKFVLDEKGQRILQGPWLDSPDWMYKKTPLKQVLKLAPKSREMLTALSLEDRHDAGIPQRFSSSVPLELQPAANSDEPAIEPPQRKSATAPSADLAQEVADGTPA